MTLPNQPSSALSVLGNEEFFRIRQPVGSPGDIFEVDSSTRAIYLGPLSDVSEVGVDYLDTQAQRSMNLATISAGGPFVNRLDALLDQPYPGLGGQTGKLLAYPIDNVDPAYVRAVSEESDTPARRYNLVPYIDLICALKTVPSIPQVRPDKTYRLKVPMNNEDGDEDNGSTDLVIPIYGRRMVSIYEITPAHVPHFVNVFQASLPFGVSPQAATLGFYQIFSVNSATTTNTVFRASDQNNGAPTGVLDSSDPAFPDYTLDTIRTNNPLNSVKGMGDLLILNFQPSFGMSPPAGYSMLDVIIRVSDREV